MSGWEAQYQRKVEARLAVLQLERDPTSTRASILKASFSRIVPGVVIPDDVLSIESRVSDDKLKRMADAERATVLSAIATAAEKIKSANDELDDRDLWFVLTRVFRLKRKTIRQALMPPQPAGELAVPMMAPPPPVVLAVLSWDELDVIADVVWNKLHDMRLWSDGAPPESLLRASEYLAWLQRTTEVPRGLIPRRVVAGPALPSPVEQLLALPPASVVSQHRPAAAALNSRPGLDRPLPASLGCQFPLWSDERQVFGHQHCGAPLRDGSSYCDEHHRVCWVAIPRRRAANSGMRGAASLN